MEGPCFLYRLAAAVSRNVPVGVAYAIAHRLADVSRCVDAAGRHGVQRNIERILCCRGVPADAAMVRRYVCRTYRNFGAYLVDFFRYSWDRPHDLDRRVEVLNAGRVEDVLSRGRGGIVVTAHIGSWELGGLVMGRMGYPITAVYRPYADVRLDRYFRRHRAGRGVELLPLGRAMIGLLRTLKHGGLIALLADRDFTRNDHRVNFFGAPARMPAGPVRLSLHTGAPLLPAFLTRRADGNYRLRFDPPIDPEEGEGDSAAMQTRIALAMERAVGDDPDQWFVFRDFWQDGNAPGGRVRERKVYGSG